jgi:hypothetical protein
VDRSFELGAFSKNAVAGMETSYNFRMAFAIYGLRVLEVMFFVGLVGSSVVVLISFVEDAKELFGKD